MRVPTFALLAALAALAAPASAQDASFAVVGHVRGAATGEQHVLLEPLLEDLAELGPDFVVLTGDMIWGDYHLPKAIPADIRRDWERLDAAFGRLGVPIYRVPGNHDVSDGVTRDIYRERYGELPSVVRRDGLTLIFLNSSWSPKDDGPQNVPRPNIRGVDLDERQIAFLETELGRTPPGERIFVFLHHMLWWAPNAAWWTQVHPLLRKADVEAVIAGDYGPLKFSHVNRDGVDYLQSSIEGRVSLPLLRNLPSSRTLYYQMDNFLWITVKGQHVNVEVRTLAPLESGKYTPDIWYQVTAPISGGFWEDIRRALGGPIRRAIIALMVLGNLAVGIAVGWMLAGTERRPLHRKGRHRR